MATCSVSDSPLILLRNCSMTLFRPIKFPLLSFVCKPSAAIAAAASFGGADSLDRVARKDVPMVDASMPLFAITPIAAPNSSMEMPSVAAGAPAYCMARPKSCIPSFDEFAAAWMTSATCVVFAATSPVRRFQISNADVMTSDVAARSSPDATDASMMAGMAPMTCCALKPPAANRSMPSAASFAEIGNSAPSLPATARICSNSSDVAPALTPAAVTVASKSMKDFTPMAPIAADAPAIGAIASAMEPSDRLTPFISLAR